MWVKRDRDKTERFENCPFVSRESLRFASFPESRQSCPEIARPHGFAESGLREGQPKAGVQRNPGLRRERSHDRAQRPARHIPTRQKTIKISDTFRRPDGIEGAQFPRAPDRLRQ